jgi:phage terminase large subunit GpA-like protein
MSLLELTDREREIWRTSRWASLSEWAEASIVLPPTTPAPGPLDLDVTPYARLPMDCILYPHTEIVTIVAGAQMVKTLIQIVLTCYVIDQMPTNVLFLMGGEKDANEIATDRIAPVIKASPVLSRYIQSEHRQLNIDKIEANGANIYFGSANVPGQVASRSIEIGLADESHLYKVDVSDEGNPLKLQRKRLENYPGSKQIHTSTPTNDAALVWVEYEKGTQHKLRFRCIHCGESQAWDWHDIKVPDGMRDPNRIKAEMLAYYVCPTCGGIAEETDKPAMLASCHYVTDNTLENPPHYSFHLQGMASPWRSFSKIMSEFFEARNSPPELKVFINTTVGENFNDSRNYLSREALEMLANNPNLERGVCPKDTLLVTCGCDWHGARKGLYWLICAWTAGAQMWVIDYGVAGSEEELRDDTVARRFRTDDPKDGRDLHALIGVDSGWGEAVADVYEYTRETYPQTRPTKGMDHSERSAPVWKSNVDYTQRSTGKHFAGFTALHYNSGFYKDRLAALLRESKPTEAEEEMEGGVWTRGRFHLPREVDREFIKSLSSQRKIVRKGKAAWEPKYEGINDHWLDCAVIAMAVADQHGLPRVDAAARKPPPAGSRVPKFRTPDGRPFLVTER